MKKLILLIPLIVSFLVGVAQKEVPRSSVNNTVVDPHLFASRNFRPPIYNDTSQANTQFPHLDSVGRIIFTRDVNGHWGRADNPKRWVRIGRPTVLNSSNSILVTGAGDDADPYIPTLIPSQQSGNIIQIFPDGAYATTQTQTQNFRIGGDVIWETGLTYTVTAATYSIGGVTYNSPETSITLDNADQNLNRFDGFVLTTSGTAINLTGTPAADPLNPSFDPTTQLPLTFVQVTANTTEPIFCRDSIYFPNNVQTWTGVVSNPGRINLTSTNNPYSVTQVIEFTAAQNNDQLRLTKATVISWGTYSVLVLKIRSKGTWPANSRVNIRAFNVLTPLGINVALGDGIFGFNSSNTATYQTIAIPLPNLGAVVNADNILFTVSTTGANTLGFYLDDIQLLGCEGTPVPVTGRFWSQGGDRWGTTGVIGTLDNFPMQHVVNNINHTILNANSTIGMQGTDPGISFQLNSFSNADYYIRRIANTLTFAINTGAILDNRISGTSVYSLSAANGALWNKASGGTFQMQLDSIGNLRLGTNATNTNTIFQVNSTTKGSHPAPSMTSTQMNAIVTPLAGDLVVNTSAGNQIYYYTGSVWLPLGNLYTADNGLTMTGSNVQWGGTLIQPTTITGVNYPVSMTWNTLTGSGLALSSTSVVGDDLGNQRLFTVLLSGANTTPSADTYAAYFSNTHTGTGAFNHGIFVTASGGSTNIAVDAYTANGTAIKGIADLGSGIRGETTGGIAGSFEANGGTGLRALSIGGLALRIEGNDASTNTIYNTFRLYRTTSGTGAIGIGQSFEFQTETSSLTDVSTALISRWTDATYGTRTSEFSIKGANNGTLADLFILSGSGATRLNKYGIGTFAGTEAFLIGVEADGDLVEVTIGGGLGDVTKVGTPVNDQVAVWTGNGTLEGPTTLTFAAGALTVGLAGTTTGQLKLAGSTSTQVTIQSLAVAGNYTLTLPPNDGGVGEFLQTDGAGNLVFAAAPGGGTMTSLGLTSSDITVGGSASPITTSGTYTLTLATVNGNVGAFGSSTAIPTITVNGKGLVTAVSTNAVIAPAGTLTGTTLASNVVNTSITSTGVLTSGSACAGFVICDVTMNLSGTDALGDTYYRDASGVLVRLPIGTLNQVLRVSAGNVPQWATISGSGTLTNFTFANANGFIGSVTNPTSTPQLTIGTSVSGIMQGNGVSASGITNSSTVGQVLRVTGASSYAWGALNLADADATTGALIPGSGGTGVGAPFNNGILLIGNGTGFTKANLTGTANQINIANGSGSVTVSHAFNPTEQTLSSGATINWNVTNGGNAVLTLNNTGATLATPTNLVAGYTYTLRIIQGSGGGRTITTWTNIRFPNGGTDPTLSTTAGQTDMLSIYCVSSTYLVGYFLPNVQ